MDSIKQQITDFLFMEDFQSLTPVYLYKDLKTPVENVRRVEVNFQIDDDRHVICRFMYTPPESSSSGSSHKTVFDGIIENMSEFKTIYKACFSKILSQ